MNTQEAITHEIEQVPEPLFRTSTRIFTISKISIPARKARNHHNERIIPSHRLA